MKFEVESNEIKKSIACLSSIINVNSSNIGMRHIKIRLTKDKKVELKAFNEHANGSCFLSISNLDESGDTLAHVLGKTFFNLVRSFSGTVKMSVGKRVSLLSGKSKYSISVLDPDTFDATNVSDIDYYDIKFPAPIKLKTLQSRLSSIKHCISDDSSKMELQHAYFKQVNEDGTCLALACDGVKGAIVECPPEYKMLDGCLIYKDLIESIMQIDNSNDISFLMQDDKLFIKTYNFLSASTLSDLEFPFDRVFDIYSSAETSDHKYNMCIDPESTIESISRLLYLTDPTTNSIKTSVESDNIIFEVDENNSGREEVKALSRNGLEDTDFEIYIDGKNFKEALSKTVGQVHWKSVDPEEMQFICDSDTVQFFLGLRE